MRTPEVGPRDNRAPVGGEPVIRRHAGLWPAPDGFGWFEHRKANLGCLSLDKNSNYDFLIGQTIQYRYYYLRLAAALAEIYGTQCEPGTTDAVAACERARAAAMQRAERYLRLAFGWDLIREYREETVPELIDDAWAPYLGASDSRGFLDRSVGLRNLACYTGPVSRSNFNDRLAPVMWVHGSGIPGDIIGSDGRAGYLVPEDSGLTYYKEELEIGRNEHEGAGGSQIYSYHTEVRGEASALARDAARTVSGVERPYPEDLDHRYDNTIRDTPYMFRDFACPTSGSGYYGTSVSGVGPSRLDHREAPDDAWRARDPLIDPADPRHRYSTGTPCIPESESPTASDGSPLSRYYNVRGPDDADGNPGRLRCHESELDADTNAFLPVPGAIGHYSSADLEDGSGETYVLEYSGDGAGATLQPELERMLRPTSYMIVPDSEELWFYSAGDETFPDLHIGLQSFDLERTELWSGYGLEPDFRIQTSERYAGVAPDFEGDADGAPTDQGNIHRTGPIRFFGAMVPGGTGGCTLAPASRELSDVRHVVSPQIGGGANPQSIICLLPLDSEIAAPSGLCPGPGLF